MYSKFIDILQAMFGRLAAESENVAGPTPRPFAGMASFLLPKLSGGLAGNLTGDKQSNGIDQAKFIKRERHAVRPPVEHQWSLPGAGSDAKPPQIFQHELLQNFSFNMFCKVYHSLRVSILNCESSTLTILIAYFITFCC